jgi:hypothetical protein
VEFLHRHPVLDLVVAAHEHSGELASSERRVVGDTSEGESFVAPVWRYLEILEILIAEMTRARPNQFLRNLSAEPGRYDRGATHALAVIDGGADLACVPFDVLFGIVLEAVWRHEPESRFDSGPVVICDVKFRGSEIGTLQLKSASKSVRQRSRGLYRLECVQILA